MYKWRAISATCLGVVQQRGSSSLGSRLRKKPPSMRTAIRRILICVHFWKGAPRFLHTLGILSGLLTWGGCGEDDDHRRHRCQRGGEYLFWILYEIARSFVRTPSARERRFVLRVIAACSV